MARSKLVLFKDPFKILENTLTENCLMSLFDAFSGLSLTSFHNFFTDSTLKTP